ncbi:hypothetical protein LX36DRAFT_709831 [Colletotrichum falcatum]|nr:hypothetical protein LX36DRAFT_709831 [Colletotrichum falcatum]
MSTNTPSTEVICSVVFGIIASVLAVVGVVQNCLRRRVRTSVMVWRPSSVRSNPEGPHLPQSGFGDAAKGGSTHQR